MSIELRMPSSHLILCCPFPFCLQSFSTWTEEPGGLEFMGSQRVRHDWVAFTFTSHMLSYLLFHFSLCLSTGTIFTIAILKYLYASSIICCFRVYFYWLLVMGFFSCFFVYLWCLIGWNSLWILCSWMLDFLYLFKKCWISGRQLILED